MANWSIWNICTNSASLTRAERTLGRELTVSLEKEVPAENVVVRLRRRLGEARGMGFNVRLEPLEGEQASWCEIAGIPTLFVDLSQTAAEQLQQVEQALAAYLGGRTASDPSNASADVRPPSGAGWARRAG